MYIMNISYTTATDLKQNTSSIINSVFYTKTPIIIERHGKPMVKIIPLDEPDIKNSSIKEDLDKFFASIPDIEIVKSKRFFRKKDLSFS
ncbi:MAG: hypothetical protein COZ34_03950 [Candidatus Pacebacteria bacterium CG_4_10_14_3_um_filter_34_15]|nr:type II toxin-antitoxin system Phd/YefM family antitoxin [Candidatus Paceibacterota bacterium]PIX81308.1 MAG: hypothetical protein COZ34_03950 [Candidatus Pacebacteria bacterium CG_4_10_14_3_um_filter_34_15]PJC43391.1 MAG: hypothetical protein CO039_04455 [Candidatus Pacebacteria bacterium CG_4_9_14_0_2_um_filter_34_50]